MLLLPAREPARPAPRSRHPGRAWCPAVPYQSRLSQPLTSLGFDGTRRARRSWNRGLAHAARGAQRHRRVVTLVHHAQRFDGALATVLEIGLVEVEAIDIEPGDVNMWMSSDDQIGEHPDPDHHPVRTPMEFRPAATPQPSSSGASPTMGGAIRVKLSGPQNKFSCRLRP